MKRVWIVDDDAEMSEAIALMLKLLDCETRSFPDARLAAKALLSGECPDLMILDINMPDVTGIDLLKFLRSRLEWKNLPVVMLSTEASDVQIDQALGIGADAYATKPATIEELDAAMNRALVARWKR